MGESALKKAQQYQPGDFVYHNKSGHFGFVFNSDKDRLFMHWVEDEGWDGTAVGHGKEDFIPTTQETFLQSLSDLAGKFDYSARAVGGMVGAIETRRAFNIQSVITRIEEGIKPEDLTHLFRKMHRIVPRTGLYVVAQDTQSGRYWARPHYPAFGMPTLGCLEIKSDPPLTEKTVQNLVTDLKPFEFVDRGWWNSKTRYEVFEIPEEGRQYCPEPQSLDDIATITMRGKPNSASQDEVRDI